MSALDKIFSLPTYEWGGRTNQVTHECLDQNSKSSYVWVDG